MSLREVVSCAAIWYCRLKVANNSACYLRAVAQSRPYSRALEEEADHVGMVILARACLDPSVVPESLKALSVDQEEGWDELDTVSRRFSTPNRSRSCVKSFMFRLTSSSVWDLGVRRCFPLIHRGRCGSGWPWRSCQL